MNKKNNRITSYFILFSLVLIIGVAFAILQANLQINGIAKISENQWNVHFENIVVNPDSVSIGTGDTAATIDPTNNCKVDFSVTLSLPGDFYEFTVDAKNSGTIDAMIGTLTKTLKVNNIETETAPNYLNYSVTYDDGTEILENHLLAKATKETYKVRVEFKTDIDEEDLPDDTTLSMSLEPVFIQADNGAINRHDATFIDGKSFNVRIKQLAGTSNATHTSRNTNITAIRKSATAPDMNSMTNDNIVSISGDPIYVWFDNGTIYYYSESNKLFLNADASYMFYEIENASIIEIDQIDTSKTTDMSYMFRWASSSVETSTINLSNWDTSNVIDMSYMFSCTFISARTWSMGDISNWDTSNVKNMESMFGNLAEQSNNFSIGDISDWDTSSVTNMSYMFDSAGLNATTFNLDLSNWNVSNVTDMSYIFRRAGYSATTWSIGDLSNWNVSNVTDMTYMFSEAGDSATTWSIGDLSNWNVSNVTNMHGTFFEIGYNASTLYIGNLSNWNTSKVTNMSCMFKFAGDNATTFSLMGLSNWDVSNVTNMSQMFYGTGINSSSFDIGNLSNWNTSNVTDMESMFKSAGKNATTWNSIGTLKVYASIIKEMFQNCPNAKVTLKIYNNPTSYTDTFKDAATVSGSGITVDYTNSVTDIDNIIATKSSDSNVVKGSLFS